MKMAVVEPRCGSGTRLLRFENSLLTWYWRWRVRFDIKIFPSKLKLDIGLSLALEYWHDLLGHDDGSTTIVMYDVSSYCRI